VNPTGAVLFGFAGAAVAYFLTLWVHRWRPAERQADERRAGEVITLEYKSDRLNLLVDDDDVVVDASLG
jgi:hypothetical protein